MRCFGTRQARLLYLLSGWNRVELFFGPISYGGYLGKPGRMEGAAYLVQRGTVPSGSWWDDTFVF
jgi:hypothetical protein